MHTHTVVFGVIESADCTHPSVDHASSVSFQKRHSDASVAERAPCGMRIAICDDAEDEDDEEDEGRSRMTTGTPESAARIENDTIGASVVVAAARSANANTFCTLIERRVDNDGRRGAGERGRLQIENHMQSIIWFNNK